MTTLPTVNLGNIVKSAAIRTYIYTSYLAIILVTGGTQVYYQTVTHTQPSWLSGIIAILTYLSIPLAGLALANVTNTTGATIMPLTTNDNGNLILTDTGTAANDAVDGTTDYNPMPGLTLSGHTPDTLAPNANPTTAQNPETLPPRELTEDEQTALNTDGITTPLDVLTAALARTTPIQTPDVSITPPNGDNTITHNPDGSITLNGITYLPPTN